MSFSFTEPLGTSENDDFEHFQSAMVNLISLLNSMIETAEKSKELESVYKNTLFKIEALMTILENEVVNFFNNNKEYTKFVIQGKNFIQSLQFVILSLPPSNTNFDQKDITNAYQNLRNLIQFFRTVVTIAENEKLSNELISSLQKEVDKARETVKQVESAKRALDGQKTEEIYSEASKNFLESARNYEVIFYMLFGGAVLVTIISLSLFPYSDKNLVNFILFKVLTITLVLTLGTLFLRKAAHLRKLHEQAHQTSLELRALPLYLAEVEKSEHSAIYKDLATKYFGKELDKTQHDKIGDLMNEQIKTSLEVFKTSTEIVKSLKPSLMDTTSTNTKDQKNPSEN